MTRQELEVENDGISQQIRDINDERNRLGDKVETLNERRLRNMAEINRLLREELEATK